MSNADIVTPFRLIQQTCRLGADEVGGRQLTSPPFWMPSRTRAARGGRPILGSPTDTG